MVENTYPFEPLIEKNVVDKTSGTPAEEVTLRFGPWFVFRMTINKSLWNRLVLSKAKKSLLLWLAESTVHHPDSEDAIAALQMQNFCVDDEHLLLCEPTPP